MLSKPDDFIEKIADFFILSEFHLNGSTLQEMLALTAVDDWDFCGSKKGAQVQAVHALIRWAGGKRCQPIVVQEDKAKKEVKHVDVTAQLSANCTENAKERRHE